MEASRLAEIQARCKAATPGPWAWECVGEKSNEWCLGIVCDDDGNPLSGMIEKGQGVVVESIVTEADGFNNADFIAHARQDIPDLLAYIAELQDALAALECLR